jgi:hypothetical protein
MTPWRTSLHARQSWARLYPYGQTAKAGTVVRVALRITNHAPRTTPYQVRWNVPSGWERLSDGKKTTISAHQDGQIEAEFKVSGPGLHVITADVSFGNWRLPAWTESLVRVE